MSRETVKEARKDAREMALAYFADIESGDSVNDAIRTIRERGFEPGKLGKCPRCLEMKLFVGHRKAINSGSKARAGVYICVKCGQEEVAVRALLASGNSLPEEQILREERMNVNLASLKKEMDSVVTGVPTAFFD